MRVFWICVTLLLFVSDINAMEDINWEVGSQYAVLSYADLAKPSADGLLVQSQSSGKFYFGFTLSEKMFVTPTFSLTGIGDLYLGSIGFQLQYYSLGYAKSGVFVLGLVDAVFSNAYSAAPGSFGFGVGYQHRLESNFVFRISAAITPVLSEPESRGAGSPRPFEVDGVGGQVHTSLGYTFNTSQ